MTGKVYEGKSSVNNLDNLPSDFSPEDSPNDVSDRVTVSVGVASLIPREGMRKEQLIKMADEALYIAKKKGRNRVEVYTEISTV